MIKATVYIESMVERTLNVPVANVTIANMPEGLKAELDATITEYEVEISGLAADINPVRAAELRGKVDIGEWMESRNITELKPGKYEIPIVFDLGEDVKAEEVKMKIKVVEKM